MLSRGIQRRGAAGTCGSTAATADAICDRAAPFRNRSLTCEELNGTFFAETTPRCIRSGARTRGILRDKVVVAALVSASKFIASTVIRLRVATARQVDGRYSGTASEKKPPSIAASWWAELGYEALLRRLLF